VLFRVLQLEVQAEEELEEAILRQQEQEQLTLGVEVAVAVVDKQLVRLVVKELSLLAPAV
jgi:hypothetical protein